MGQKVFVFELYVQSSVVLFLVILRVYGFKTSWMLEIEVSSRGKVAAMFIVQCKRFLGARQGWLNLSVLRNAKYYIYKQVILCHLWPSYPIVVA